MSGVTTASRLEQLEQLAAHVAHELAQERHRVSTGQARSERALIAPAPRVIAADILRMHSLGVTAAQVRAWAVGQGLVPAGRVGRLPITVYDAYAKAHP